MNTVLAERAEGYRLVQQTSDNTAIVRLVLERRDQDAMGEPIWVTMMTFDLTPQLSKSKVPDNLVLLLLMDMPLYLERT